MTDDAIDTGPEGLEADAETEDLAPDSDELADEQPEPDSRTTPDPPDAS